ncbi:DUF4919 domain-containing protein [Ferruginibacter sp. SUN106]|uniref:DUF4919 domain-containing protein n=1 Tax=Ferruginibacter sp. SUN106 TaxID=2978348 RepID=UPI003D35C1B1
MKKASLIIVFLFGNFLLCAAQEKFLYTKDFKIILAKTKDAGSNLFYDKLLKRFQADDSTLTRPEILSLLIGFTDKPAYKPYTVLETERLIYKLNDDGKFKAAHDTAVILLKTYPLSYQGLKELSYSYSKLDKADSAEYTLNLVAKIMSAMMYSGDGRSAETAMFALGPADGQHLITGAGLSLGSMGSGRDKSGNFLDMLQAVTKEGDKIQMYFNIQHAVLKMFDGKSAKEMMEEQDKKKTNNKN